MGIFTRLTDIINSNVNSILDRAEEPEKIIRLVIQEMEDTLVEARSAAARTIAERKEVVRSLDRIRQAQSEWERRAEVALGKGREDLSRAALVEKAKLTAAIADMDAELQALDDAMAKGEEDIVKLEAKLREAKAKQKTIQARHDTASRRIKVRRQVHSTRIEDAFTRFEQVERRLDGLEGEVEAFDVGRGKSLADELADLETEADVEAELARLKERLAGSGTAKA